MPHRPSLTLLDIVYIALCSNLSAKRGGGRGRSGGGGYAAVADFGVAEFALIVVVEPGLGRDKKGEQFARLVHPSMSRTQQGRH
jgi:hypothetical protein